MCVSGLLPWLVTCVLYDALVMIQHAVFSLGLGLSSAGF